MATSPRTAPGGAPDTPSRPAGALPGPHAPPRDVAEWFWKAAAVATVDQVEAVLAGLDGPRCTTQVVHSILAAMRVWHDSLRAKRAATTSAAPAGGSVESDASPAGDAGSGGSDAGGNGAGADGDSDDGGGIGERASGDSPAPPARLDAATRATHYRCWAVCIRFLGRRLREYADAPVHQFQFPASGEGELRLAPPLWGYFRGFSYSVWVHLPAFPDPQAPSASPTAGAVSSQTMSVAASQGAATEDGGGDRGGAGSVDMLRRVVAGDATRHSSLGGDSNDAVASQQSSQPSQAPPPPRRTSMPGVPSVPGGASPGGSGAVRTAGVRRFSLLRLTAERAGVEVAVSVSRASPGVQQLEYRVFNGAWRVVTCGVQLRRSAWAHVTVTHSYPYVGRSTATVFVNGTKVRRWLLPGRRGGRLRLTPVCSVARAAQVHQDSLVHPSFGNATAIRTASIGQGFYGAVAHPTL